MRKVFLSFILLAVLCASGLIAQETPYSYENQLDINNASFEDIARLPVSSQVAERIHQHIEYQGPFTSVFQLRDIEGIDQELLLTLKPLVRIEPYSVKTERENRIEQLYFRLDRWQGDEGTNQALIDSWIEQALEPVNINDIRYDQLLNLQGVSPVDAAAIINYRNQVGRISSLRDLRSTPYLSYFGYRNTRDFVSFDAPQESREFHGHILFRANNTPFFSDEAEAEETSDFTGDVGIENNYPDIYTRLSANYGGDLKLGLSYWHALEEPVLSYNAEVLDIPRGKFYVGLENKKLGPVDVRKVYVGSYSLAFGHGVVMENTDFFQPRKSGLGFRKRFLGLSGDNSRTRQYQLSGVATELAYDKAHLFLFGAFNNRDAILNRTPILFEGEEILPVNQFIVLDQRFDYAPGDDFRFENEIAQRDAVKELLYGFHAAYDFLPTTQLGFTYYESAYDRPLRPDIEEIVNGDDVNQITMPDNEIFNSYGGEISDGENPFWGDAKSFRRVYGLSLNSVYQNVAFQAEYAELDRQGSLALFGTNDGDNPWAFVGSALVQYNNFHLLGLYRNYQLGFDNPYQRSFSNYQRYKRTIYEDYFYLQSPYYGQLYTNNPQPQAEEGFYFDTRYQINRQMVLSMEYDNWRRQADDVTQYRLRGTLQYRPIFPLSINLRQKYQAREALNNVTTEYFENLEFRGEVRMRLSRFDELRLLYVNALTKFRPRPRLYYPTDEGADYEDTNLAGNIGSPGEALGGSYSHNFNEWLKVRGFLGYYKGFFWNFEDTQFAVLNSNRGALRYWISVYSRISPRVSIRAKLTRERQYPITFQHTRNTDNEEISQVGQYFQADLLQNTELNYYMELNFHF